MKGHLVGRAAFLDAATHCMNDRGYHGTSIRDIAAVTGTTTAAIYYHFASKQEILVALMDRALSTAFESTLEAVSTAADNPVDRLAAAMHAWALFHAEHREEATIGATELRSLEPENRARVVEQRDRQESLFRELIEQGRDAGHFSVSEAHLAARALIAMGNSVATWYRPDGPLTPTEVADEYVHLSLGLVRTAQP